MDGNWYTGADRNDSKMYVYNPSELGVDTKTARTINLKCSGNEKTIMTIKTQ